VSDSQIVGPAPNEKIIMQLSIYLFKWQNETEARLTNLIYIVRVEIQGKDLNFILSWKNDNLDIRIIQNYRELSRHVWKYEGCHNSYIIAEPISSSP